MKKILTVFAALALMLINAHAVTFTDGQVLTANQLNTAFGQTVKNAVPANGITLTAAGASVLTVPLSGTLATLTGTEAFTNKSLNNISGLMLGNGLSAATAFGGTSCSNQFVRSLSVSGVATCATVGSSDLATALSLTTPNLNVATATSINKLTITAPATSAVLTVADGKTLTVNNSLTLAGTDGTTLTFQGTGTYVGRATTDTFTNKTFDTAGTGNSFLINGTGITSVTGSGAAVLANGGVMTAPNIGAATGTSVSLTALSKINLNAASMPSAPAGTILQGSYTDSTGPLITLETSGAGAGFLGRRANTSLAAPSALATGNVIASLNAQGYGATGYVSGNSGRLMLLANGTWTDSSSPTSFSVQLTPSGSTTAATVATIDNAGNALFNGTANPAANMTFGGASSLASWTTNGAGLRAVAATYTNTSTATSGTAATGHIHTFAQPTIAASNTGVTVTDAATVYIAGPPIAGTNVTISSPYALEIGSGISKLPIVAINNPVWASTAPTISSGFGTSPSVSANNGTAAFRVNVGTGGSATSGVIGLPTAATGWNCFAGDVTTQSATVLVTKQTASTTTSATVGNFNTAGVAAAWVSGDTLAVSCFAY